MSIRNNILKLALVTAAAISSWSCLEKLPQSAIRQDEAIETFSDAEQALTGIYNALMSGALYGGYLTLAPDIQADLVYAVDGYSNTYGDFWLWKTRGNDTYVQSVWTALYRVIGRCNFYLEKVDAVRESLQDDDLITTLDCYTGEAYLARAIAYSELIKCFCKAYESDEAAKNELGVVLRTSYSKEETAKRSSLYDSYQLVLDDLAKAEELLDEDDDAYSNYYLSLAAAHSLHARVALYMKNWDDAIKYSTKVIDKNDTFRLATNTIYSGTVTYLDYMWTYDLAFEIIWELGYTYTNYGAATGQVFLNYNRDFYYFYPDYVPAAWCVNLYGSADGRYWAYFSDGSEKIGYGYTLPVPLLVKYFGNIDFIQSYRLYHVNMPKVFRLAEQYLIRAEAYCNNKDYSSASADLSTMRSSRISSGGAISVTENNWLETISDERVRELYMEGFRLHDLKRWHKGFERKHQANALKEGSSMKIEADDPRFVWPIPRHEIEAPGSQVEPNESNI